MRVRYGDECSQSLLGFFSKLCWNCAVRRDRSAELHLTWFLLVSRTTGTGGTIAGISRCLKEFNPQCKAYLIDPPGSSLFNKVNYGVLYTSEEAEGRRLRNPFDTITEGIGINRLTANFAVRAPCVDLVGLLCLKSWASMRVTMEWRW